MRISDCSSDVCPSDLPFATAQRAIKVLLNTRKSNHLTRSVLNLGMRSSSFQLKYSNLGPHAYTAGITQKPIADIYIQLLLAFMIHPGPFRVTVLGGPPMDLFQANPELPAISHPGTTGTYRPNS